MYGFSYLLGIDINGFYELWPVDIPKRNNIPKLMNMKTNRRIFLKHTGLAGLGLAGSRILLAGTPGGGTYEGNPGIEAADFTGEADRYQAYKPALTFAGRKVFVEEGKPVSVAGSGTRNMYREGNELVLPVDKSWGNPLYADAALTNSDFHVHARLRLGKLAGTGASFLFGGHYHYPCLRPEANVTFRVSLDDDFGIERSYLLEPDVRIVYGMTKQRAPWHHAEKEIAGKAADHIKPGIPFDLDFIQKGEKVSFRINGNEVFDTSLKDRISGLGDAGWPACIGFYPCRGHIRLQEFYAEGTFTDQSLKHNDVWTFGTDGYLNYRIPSLCVTPGGTLLAFAEARRFDWCRARDWQNRNHDEVDCVMKRSTDGGKTWSGQEVILQRGNSYEARDPSPVVDRETGDVFLMVRGPYIVRIGNEGKSWSEPRSLRGVLGKGMDGFTHGPGQGIQLRRGSYKGRLMVPFYTGGTAGLIYSDDHGKNWKIGASIEPGRVEPQVIELEDGRILMNSRNQTDKPGRLISVSHDGGTSFREHYTDEQLTSHTCQASLIRYNRPGEMATGKKEPVLFCGPGENRSRRNFRLHVSYDECESWVNSPVIYSGHTAYSGMAVLPDGQIGVLYEKDGYRRLSFVSFPIDWVTGKNIR
jgi:sialidase-1